MRYKKGRVNVTRKKRWKREMREETHMKEQRLL